MKLTSPKAYKVIKYLLTNKRTNNLEISRETGVAYSWTNEILNFLYDRHIVSKGWRTFELKDQFKLLEAVALERPINKLVTASFRLETSSVIEGEAILKRICEKWGVKYGFTVFSGLRRFYEYYISFPEIHVYVSDKKIEKNIPHGLGPITVSLLQPDQKSILDETKKINGFSVCSPIQVAIDLFCSNIGRDGAIKFLEVIPDVRF